MLTKVAIINAGELSQADGYDHFIKTLTEVLDEDRQAKLGSGEKAAEVRTVKSVSETRSYLNGKGVAIFLTRGMQDTAEALAKENPKMRVLIFTRLLPEGKVIYASKGWATSRNQIKKFVLDLC